MANNNNVEKMKDRIKSSAKLLSKTEKKIADYFIENSNAIAFLSIHEIASKMNVGPGSIMRFSKKMGYSGFASLKKDLSHSIQDEIAPLEKFKLLLDNPVAELNTIEQIAKNEVDNINSLVNNFDKQQFEAAVETIIKAENIYTLGFGLSSHIASLTSYLLRRIGLKAYALNKLGITFPDQIMPIGNKDILIAYSLPPYSKETIESAKYFFENKSKVIGITNKLTVPIVEYSSICFIVKTSSKYITNSLSAINVLIYSLINEIAIRDKYRAKKAIEDIISKRK